MVEFTRCFLARAKICRAVKIFVYVSKSAQTWPEIQPQVESCYVLQLNSVCINNWNRVYKTTIDCNMVHIWPWCSKLLKVSKSPKKNKIEINYKLHFIQNSHRDVVFATQYNHRLNSVVVFCCVRRYVGLQKHLSAFRHPHKNDLKYNRGLNLSWFTTW